MVCEERETEGGTLLKIQKIYFVFTFSTFSKKRFFLAANTRTVFELSLPRDKIRCKDGAEWTAGDPE